jgi:hypothetical protein
LIYYLQDSRFPRNAAYTDNEKVTIKNLFGMYYSFAMTGKPKFGSKTLDPIQFGIQFRINEIVTSKLLKSTIINETFGNSNFWDQMNPGS